jgi:Tfp pilus assembly protein PilE
MNFKRKRNMGGYTLVETIFYIALFAVLSIAIVDALIAMTRSFRETAVQTDLVKSALIMERITREIKQSYGINSISASDLKLNIKDDLGVNKTVRFVLNGQDVAFYDNDTLIGNLNATNIDVTGLAFTEITTTEGKAVRIVLSVTSTRDTASRIETFYGTLALRGDYGN